jgi:glucans biosynthesis protein
MPRTPRRTAHWVVALTLAAAAPVHAAFGLDTVAERAQQLAGQPYKDPKGSVPDWLLSINYDQWRDIRYRAEEALWKKEKLPFQVQFFHPGLFYDRVVRINVVEGDKVRPLEFTPSQFDYGKNDFASRVPQKLGYAGFRVHAPIKKADYFDEVIVFLGATYFRALGKDEGFGLSARGLAIDTAESRGEEFPWFKQFWLVRPKAKDSALTIYALLDSPRVTGAYRFAVTPGDQTKVDVETRLFFRDAVGKLGVAPATSMFYHGENSRRWFDDFRPEVHDSDGVLLHAAEGEWIWRPVENPKSLHVSSFGFPNPRGFGLLQRDRAFDHYQDLETSAERRPSLWIEPKGDWGDGRVEIIEIPTTNDTNDNVVTFWSPKRADPKAPLSYAYTMHWYGEDLTRPPGGRVVATRIDAGTEEGNVRFVIDFAGKRLASIPADQVVRGVVTVQGGSDIADIVGQHVVKNPHVDGWRLTFQIKPKRRDPIEIRAFLDQGNETLTETWSYAASPP